MWQRLWHRFISSRRKEIPFIIFFWFLVSFLVARVWVWLMQTSIIPDIYLNVRGIHVHHFNYGIVLTILIGFLALAARSFTERHIHGMSVMFGIGLGLIFDEFSLFILLEDNYWARYSYNAIIIISLIFLNIIYFQGFWKYIARKMHLNRVTQLHLFRKK